MLHSQYYVFCFCFIAIIVLCFFSFRCLRFIAVLFFALYSVVVFSSLHGVYIGFCFIEFFVFALRFIALLLLAS